MLRKVLLVAFPVAAAIVFHPSIASASSVYSGEITNQNQIYNGVVSGQIDPSQYRYLQRQEAAINQQRVTDLHQNSGSLTSQDTNHLDWQLNHVSNTIAADEGLSSTLATPGATQHREYVQQQRILAGVQDNQVTPSQFLNLERREDAINAQRVADLHQNGGYLTPTQYQDLNTRLNHTSNSIDRAHHN